ncbi:MAG: histidine kinase [Rhodobacteraceae bacterium CG17_big_fil_post_rev_8_21_14_2_50_65_11]|nr:MAG: histidine kinase [Rhodobacteraceae bacterium CG17_big_fil_post_rev_8_21_14_2_50_65_11]
MPDQSRDILYRTHPYDSLPAEALDVLAHDVERREVTAGELIYTHGQRLDALYLIIRGRIDVTDASGEIVSTLGPGNSFGERGLMRDGCAATSARAAEDGELLTIPATTFRALVAEHPRVARFFDRTRPARAKRQDLTTMSLDDMMTRDPLTVPPDTGIAAAARKMRDNRVSSLMVTDGDAVVGIVTTRDLTNKALAEGLSHRAPVREVMTADPMTLPPSALVSDVLHAMVERHITHMPVVEGGKLVGMLTQTDLTRFQATSSAALIQDIAEAARLEDLAKSVGRIPQLLMQLVGAHNAHQVVTRLITDVGDATTRRLLAMAEAKLGLPPVPYLWLACGSQGRQEQTGISDQDNCLIIDDAMQPGDDDYFKALATFVSDGLSACGYFYCPGDMMATADRWRQPLHVWRSYFDKWIATPNPEAQMLASVMFDLRPIGGEVELFADLQAQTLKKAAANSIFVAHMVSNSLKHTPPLGLFRGFATVRSGEHKNTLDLKLAGVVPIVDLGRIYALQGQLTEANTRARLVAAIDGGKVSASGGRDLLDAYDMIADIRLQHQAAQIRRGEKPDNFMPLTDLSDFERSHLRDAFVVVKTMQSAASQGRGYLS